MTSFVKLNDPSRKFTEPRINLDEIKELILKGPYLNGPHTEKFEFHLSNYLEIDDVIMVSSGTDAIKLSIQALEIPIGKKIGIATNAGGYAQIAAKLAGVDIQYMEIDENGLLDLELFMSTWTPEIFAIIVTNLFGQSVEVQKIRDFCDERRIIIIEDCAQSIGSFTNGKATGYYSHISTFSFYPTKNLSTVGDAGAVATKNSNLSEKIRALREYGWKDKYNSTIRNGSNSRNDELHASILLSQLKFLDEDIADRKTIWNKYRQAASAGNLQLIGNEASDFSCHLCVIKTSHRDQFMKYMKDLGIDTGIHYPKLDYQQRAFDKTEKKFPISEKWVQQIVTVPLFTKMSLSEVDIVEKALREFEI